MAWIDSQGVQTALNPVDASGTQTGKAVINIENFTSYVDGQSAWGAARLQMRALRAAAAPRSPCRS